MNLETLDILTQKIEKALGTIRALRTENQRLLEHTLSLESQVRILEGQVAASRGEQERLESEIDVKVNEASNLTAELSRKDNEIASLRGEVEQRMVEVTRMQDSLREKEEKIQGAASRLEQVMNSLERELDVRIDSGEEQELLAGNPISEDRAYSGPTDLFGNPQL